MAIGPGEVTPKGEKIPMLIKVGQKVMYKNGAETKLKSGSEEWTIIDQKDVLIIDSN